jgi:hypothetical protein
MVENFQAKKKLWDSKVDEIGFLLGNPVYVHFARMKRQVLKEYELRHGKGRNRIATLK